MYAHFYHLAENPFNLTPDPKFHYINESTREAMASILHGIHSRKGFVTLIGEAGTGKTTLLKRIVEEIEGETQVVFVFNPGVSFDELLEFICAELGLPTDNRRRLTLLDRLNNFLLEQLTEGRNVVVMIDEAQTMDDGVLEELRLLSNLETSKEKILQILLSGQCELEEKLRRPNLRQLRQRIAVRANLRPMRADEIGAYVETRMRSAGAADDDFFSAAALRKIWRASKGIPRVINVICDNAMMIAFADGKKRITGGVISEAIRDLQGGERRVPLVERLRGWGFLAGVRYPAAAAVALGVAVPLALATIRAAGPGGPLHGGAPTEAPAVAATPAPAVERQPAPAVAAPTAAPPARRMPVARPQAQVARPASVRPPAAAAAAASSAATPAATQADARSSVTGSKVVQDSIRRAELMARSTAARLFDRKRDTLQDSVNKQISEGNALSLDSVPGGMVEAAAEAEEMAAELMRRQSGSAAARKRAEARVRASEPPAIKRPQPRATTDDATATDGKPAGGTRGEARADQAGGDGGESPMQLAMAGDSPASPDPKAASKAVTKSAPKSAAKQTAKPVVAAPAPAAEPAVTPERAAEVTEPTTIAMATPPAEMTAISGRFLGPNDDEPMVGRLVKVLDGDTLWDVAVAHYGTAGPVTVKRILNSNPRIRDPRVLEVGAHIYLPFQRPDQMVVSAGDEAYSVVVAVSPRQAGLAQVRQWLDAVLTGLQLSTSEVGDGQPMFRLEITGIDSRDEALSLASEILAEYGKARSRSAGSPAAG